MHCMRRESHYSPDYSITVQFRIRLQGILDGSISTLRFYKIRPVTLLCTCSQVYHVLVKQELLNSYIEDSIIIPPVLDVVTYDYYLTEGVRNSY